MNNEKVLVRVPASTANLGPGFDTLGMALNLYTYIEMSFSDTTKVELYGSHLDGVPTDSTNLIVQVAQIIFRAAGLPERPLHVSMYSDIPLTRGLGSSASAIVGGMAAANALIGSRLPMDELFQLAARLENHPDNVGASVYGGIIVATWDGEAARHIRFEPQEWLEVLVAVPNFHLSTEKARKVLPERYERKDAVFNVSHASLLVAALVTGDRRMIRHAMKDALHQPYRAPLIPGMEAILRGAADNGALGAALSGAGPTLLALVDRANPDKARLERFFRDCLQQAGTQAELHWLKPSSEGVTQLTPTGAGCTFIENIKGAARA